MARFCTKCGKPLAEGEVCTCQQEGAQMQQQTPMEGQTYNGQGGVRAQQPYGSQENTQGQQMYGGQGNAQGQQPYGGQENTQGQQMYGSQGNTQGQQMYGGQENAQGQQIYGGQGNAQGGQTYGNQGYAGQGSQFTDQAGQMMNQFVSTSRNLFGRLVPMIKRPATELGAMAENEETSLGIQMIVLHLVVTVVMTIVSILIVRVRLGVMVEYIGIPYVKTTLEALIFTAAMDFGLAAILFVVTKYIFKSELGFGGMLPLVGGMAVVNSAALVVGGILTILSTQLGTIIIVIGAILGFMYMLGGYFKAVEISEDAKVYAMFISYAVFVIVVLLVAKVLVSDTINEIQSSMY